MHPVTGEHGVRVAVDEARQDAHAGAVDDLGKVVVGGVLGGDLIGLTHVFNEPSVPARRGKRKKRFFKLFLR